MMFETNLKFGCSETVTPLTMSYFNVSQSPAIVRTALSELVSSISLTVSETVSPLAAEANAVRFLIKINTTTDSENAAIVSVMTSEFISSIITLSPYVWASFVAPACFALCALCFNVLSVPTPHGFDQVVWSQHQVAAAVALVVCSDSLWWGAALAVSAPIIPFLVAPRFVLLSALLKTHRWVVPLSITVASIPWYFLGHSVLCLLPLRVYLLHLDLLHASQDDPREVLLFFNVLSEEIVKVSSGMFYPGQELVEQFKTHGAYAFVPFFFHAITMFLPFPLRCGVHCLYNVAVVNSTLLPMASGADLTLRQMQDEARAKLTTKSAVVEKPSRNIWLKDEVNESVSERRVEAAVKRQLNPLAPVYTPIADGKFVAYNLPPIEPDRVVPVAGQHPLDPRDWRDVPDSHLDEVMSRFGWSEWDVKSVLRSREKLAPIEEKSPKRKPLRPVSLRLGSHRESEVGGGSSENWQMHPPPYTAKVPYPSGKLTSRCVRRWLYSEFWRLHKGLTKKSQRICANDAARALLQNSGARLQQLLPLAHLYVHDYSHHFALRAPQPIRAQLPAEQPLEVKAAPREIMIGAVPVHTPDELDQLAEYFVRQRPALKAARAYLSGEDVGSNGRPLDVHVLSDLLTKAMEARKLSITRRIKQSGGAVEFVVEQMCDTEDVLYVQCSYTGVKRYRVTCGEESMWMCEEQAQRLFPELLPSVPMLVSEWTSTEQGNGISVSAPPGALTIPEIKLNHKHTVDFAYLGQELGAQDLADAIVEMSTGPTATECARVATQVVLTLISVYRAPDFPATMLVLAQFAASTPHVWAFLLERLRAFTRREQGFEDVMAELWRTVCEGCMVVWASVFGEGICSVIRNFSSELASAFNFHLKRDSMTRLAQVVVDALVSFLGRLRRCVESWSFQPLFGSDGDPILWLQHTDTLLAQASVFETDTPSAMNERRKLFEERLIPDVWMAYASGPEMRERYKQVITQGENLLKLFGHESSLNRRLGVQTNMLRARFGEVSSRLRGAEPRMAPYCTAFYGVAGVGKSVLMSTIQRTFARQYGYKTTADCIYQWDPTANFQTGLNHASWCINMDDPDQSVAPLAAGVKSFPEHVVAIVNNRPMPVEEADVSLKGKTFAYPHLLTITTNFERMNVTGKMRDVEPFWRRIHLRASVTVKPQYAAEGGSQLDPAKVPEGETDLWTFKVDFFDPTRVDRANAASCCPRTEPVEVDIHGLLKLLRAKTQSHRENQARVVEAILKGGRYCSQCFLNEGQCACGVDLLDDILELREQMLRGRCDPIGKARILYEQCSRLAMQRALSGAKEQLQEAVVRAVKLLIAPHTVVAAIGVCAVAKFLSGWWKHNQARVGNASGFLGPEWTRAASEATPGPPQHVTWTEEELTRQIAAHSLPCTGGRCLVVADMLVLIPRHMAKLGTTISITPTASHPILVEVTALNSTVAPENTDLCLLKVPSLLGYRGLMRFMYAAADSSHQYDALKVLLWREGVGSWTPGPSNQVMTIGTDHLVTTPIITVDGDCGSPYIVQCGSGWRLRAIHQVQMTNMTGSVRAGGMIFTRACVQAMAARLGSLAVGVQTVQQGLSKDPSTISFVEMPFRSEYQATVRQHGPRGLPIGSLDPPLRGSTMRSKVCHSILEPHARALAERWCGEPDYWQVPRFEGERTEDGFWNSPFTEALAVQATCDPEPKLVLLAVMDYLNGLDLLDADGYRPLSEEETFVGVPGSTIRAANFKTSVGPPYAGPKSQYAERSEEGVFATSEIWNAFDETEYILSEGDAPSSPVVWTLKDEAVKPGKRPRTFIVYPAGVNLKVKQYMAPIQAFMRDNYGFFESFVGINMTSAESTRVVCHLRRCDPTLEKVVEFDVSKMDMSFCGAHWDAISMVEYAVAHRLGMDPNVVVKLNKGNRNSLHLLKSDAFYLPRNSSGGADTVWLNSKNLSLGERVVYYADRRRRDPAQFERDFPDAVLASWLGRFLETPTVDVLCGQLDYRTNVALATFGDDGLMTRVAPLPEDYQELWRKHWGFVVTDGQKRATVGTCPLAEASFLKRGFLWDEELQRHLTPLSKKSLARTLTFTRPSNFVSQKDLAAISLSEVARELVYHGQKDYEEYVALALCWASELELLSNPLLFLPAYAHWRAQLLDGSFSAWEDRKPVPFTAPTQVDLQFKMQSSSTMDNASDALANVPQTEGTNETFSNAQIAGPSATIAAPAAPVNNPVVLPTAPLGDIMARPQRLATLTLSDSDSPVGALYSSDAWVAFMTNPVVASKVNSFSYYRGTLKVTAVTTVPAAGFGLYVLSALPSGGASTISNTSIARTARHATALSLDHHAVIDCSAAQTVTLELPWIFHSDYAEMTRTELWNLQLFCFEPLKTGMTGGMTTGTMTIYLSCSDLELVAPKQQSSSAKSFSKAFSALSTVPYIGGASAVASGLAGKAASVMEQLGFSRESVDVLPSAMLMRAFSSTTQTDCGDTGEVASVSLTNGISLEPFGGTGEQDPGAFASLFPRWMYSEVAAWTPEMPAGQLILSMPVTPGYAGLFGEPTVASYVGLPFRYWRGTMKYKVFIPVSKMHRGALAVTWVPGPGGVTSNQVYMNQQWTVVHEATAGTCFEVTVGWSSNLPALVHNYKLNTYSSDSCNGTLEFRVVNPIVAQTLESGTEIHVFAAADVDMQFGMPTNRYLLASTEQEIWAVSYQGALGDSPEDCVKYVLVPQTTYPIVEACFGESIASVRALMQRPTVLGRYATYGSPLRIGPLGKIPGTEPGLPTSPYGTIDLWSWLNHYAVLFVGVACSERVKVLTTSEGSRGAVGACAVPCELTEYLVSWQQCFGFTTSGGMEWTIPYYGSRLFNYGFARPIPGAAGVALSQRATQIDCSSPPLAVFHSAGNDIRLVQFRQVPLTESTRALITADEWPAQFVRTP